MSQTEERSTAIVPASPVDIAKTSGDVPDDALIGETLHDTYSVVRFLAEGGMGRVYEAQHTRIATKRFAIKVLHAELKHSIDVRMRFRREAEAAACIEHPNVVGVHDFGYTSDGRPYLVSDLLEGQELHALLVDEKPISVPLAARIAIQLCSALEAAHEKGVIHRDLKPANVFLVGPNDAPEVKVLDFGLSKILEPDATDTQTGTVMGTPSYMAPEQAKGQRADHRADIYGTGAVLYACLTGKPPYEEDSPHQTVLAVMTREPVRPCILNPSIPPELEVIVQKAMAHEPGDRYRTMAEFGAALAPFADQGASARAARTSSPAPRAIEASNPQREARGVRRRAMGWIVLAALMMLVGGLSSVVGAIPLVTGSRDLLPTEILLVSLALFGSLFTPALLVVLWLRRRYWNNSAKMVDLVALVRAPVVAGAAVVGIAALAGRMLDSGSLYIHGLGPPPNASGWPGWAPFLYGLGLVAAVTTIVRARILGDTRSLFRRILAGPLLLAIATVGSAALLVVGYRLSAASELGKPPTRVTAGADSAAPSSAPSSAAPRQSAAPIAAATITQAPIEAKIPDKADDRAPDDALASASQTGADALSDLATKYPKDARVGKALALALGKEPERTSELLRVLDNLFTIAPELAADPDLSSFVRAAAEKPATSQRALDLMRTEMGSHGPDMLFDFVLTEPALRDRARAALETSEAQRNLSPAVKIAYDLFTAPTCTQRQELVQEAIKEGDERAITVLQMSSAKPAHTCGPKKNKACPAACEKEAPAFEQAIKEIQDRLAAKKANP